jgi:circadian clock protein KaiB
MMSRMTILSKKTKHRSIKKNTSKQYLFRLYTVGNTPNCVAAFNNLKKICEKYLPQRYDIEVIDLLKFPQLATDAQILAIPTVIKKLPPPICKMIGDLSNQEEVLIGLDLNHLIP